MTRPWIDPATDKLLSIFAAFPEIDLNAMGFNSNWEKEPLWMTPAR